MGWACDSRQTAIGYRPTKLIDMRNTMPTGAPVTGICGNDETEHAVVQADSADTAMHQLMDEALADVDGWTE